MRIIDPKTLTTYIAAIFAAQGAPAGTADLVASSLVGANRTGHDSHGVIRTAQYSTYIEKEMLFPAAEPTILSQEGNILRIDGNLGFGQRTAQFSMAQTITLAKETGMAASALLNSNHIGRVGEWVEMAANENMIGIAFCNGASPGGLVAPYGGRQRFLGTNPFAAAVPIGGEPPFVLDYATSVVAEGKVRVARNKGQTVPDGWLLDNEGAPTNDPHDLYNQGMLLTAGAYKGFALSMLVELLGGILAGQGSPSLPRWQRFYNGVLFLVLDIERFRNVADFLEDARQFVANVRAVPTAAGFDKIRIAGEPERDVAAARATAIPLDDNTWSQIAAVARRHGVNPPRSSASG